MTANQPKIEAKSRRGQPTTRDHVAPRMAREWGAEQGARIRAILLELADSKDSPEIQVAGMIDQEAS